MSNVRRGAFALVLAAFVSVPSVASAQTSVQKYSEPFIAQFFACGPNGEVNGGELIQINGNSDVILWQKLVTNGEWDTKMKVTQNGTGVGTISGTKYEFHLDQTSKMNLVTGADTVIVLRSMLTPVGTVGSPYDLAIKSSINVRQNASGTTTTNRNGFEVECK